MSCFAEAGALQKIKGGPGMVDCVLQPHKLGSQKIAINIMEAGALVLPPLRQPKFTPHGIAVVHPVDLCIMKLFAAKSREALRDYHDLAIAATAFNCKHPHTKTTWYAQTSEPESTCFAASCYNGRTRGRSFEQITTVCA